MSWTGPAIDPSGSAVAAGAEELLRLYEQMALIRAARQVIASLEALERSPVSS